MNTVRFSFLFLAAVWAIASGCSKEVPLSAPVAKPPVVTLQPVTYSSEAIPVRATGLLARKTEANLSFKVGGLVAELPVRAGDAVTAGQVLARLRTTEIDARVMQAKSALAKTERDLGRVEKLRADNVATTENLQDAKTAVETAAAGLQIAEFNREHSVIVAPSDGRILRRMAEPDEMVEAGHTVLAFASDGTGWIARVGLAELDAGRIRIGDSAEVRINGRDFPPISGRIAQISEAADVATRTTEVEIQLEYAPEGGRSGYVVHVVIKPLPIDPRSVVPASALIEGIGYHAGLFLVDGDGLIAHRMEVEIAGMDGEQVYLRTPLPKSSRVVVSGGEYLRDGVTVEVARN